jgi:hypothetical protein
MEDFRYIDQFCIHLENGKKYLSLIETNQWVLSVVAGLRDEYDTVLRDLLLS